jgi:eukaryotic translation initiation factor 2C
MSVCPRKPTPTPTGLPRSIKYVSPRLPRSTRKFSTDSSRGNNRRIILSAPRSWYVHCLSRSSNVLTLVEALNVVIRMGPSQEYPTKGRSFFTPGETRNIGGGLILWRGYFQSIRPAIGRMLINVDISTGVMYQAGPLIDLCLAFVGRNNPALLTRQMPDRERVALGRFITGIRVQTQDSASNAVRARVVRRLTKEGANESSFTMRSGRILTVAQYYQETRGRPLQFPALLCVEVGQIPSQITVLTV